MAEEKDVTVAENEEHGQQGDTKNPIKGRYPEYYRENQKLTQTRRNRDEHKQLQTDTTGNYSTRSRNTAKRRNRSHDLGFRKHYRSTGD